MIMLRRNMAREKGSRALRLCVGHCKITFFVKKSAPETTEAFYSVHFFVCGI